MLNNTTLARRGKQLRRAFGRKHFSNDDAVLVSVEGTRYSTLATLQLLRQKGVVTSEGRGHRAAFKFTPDAGTLLKQLATQTY